MTRWLPIADAPRDGTLVDLWITDLPDDPETRGSVVFWTDGSYREVGDRLAGRATNLRWDREDWRPDGGLGGIVRIGLSISGVRVTHYSILTAPTSRIPT